MALRPPRLPLRRRRLAQRVVAGVGAHARDVDDAVGAEGGDDVVGAAVVERVGVRGDRGADAFGDLGEGRGRAHAPASEAEVDDRALERVHVDRRAAPGAAARREGRRGSRRWSARSSRCGPRPARTGACTRSPSRAGPAAGAAGSRSPARGSAATADRRTPTPRAAWALTGSLALREPGERPDLHQRLLRPERAEAVRRRAAVHRQHEVVREAVAHRLVEALRLELVEVGDVAARVAVPAHDRVVERAVPRRHRQRRVGGQLDVAQALGDAHVVRRAPSRPCRRSSCAGSGSRRRRTPAGRTARRRAAGTAAGDDELRVRLDHVVLLHERLFGELPVHREPARVPPLGPQRLHLPRVERSWRTARCTAAAAARRRRG